MTSHCARGGWILGNTIDGTHAEFVRIPFADTSLMAVPADADDDALVMLSDILPTAYECGVCTGGVQPRSAVAIVGAGPVGLAALMTAQLFSPSLLAVIDIDDNRLAVARKLGATHTIHNGDGQAAATLRTLTKLQGVDVAIEAVGVPPTFALCQDIVAVGGRIANIGVHGKPVELHLDTLWSHNITLTTRLVDTVSAPLLLRLVLAGRLDPRKLISHAFKLDDMMQAYDTFLDAAHEKALKVIVRAA
jgi:alcohol dehydrogenase